VKEKSIYFFYNGTVEDIKLLQAIGFKDIEFKGTKPYSYFEGWMTQLRKKSND
jgi:hypothetical protein